MRNKFEPFGRAFWIVIIVAIIVSKVIGHYIELSPVDGTQFMGYFVSAAALLYGAVYYLVKKIINKINDK